MDIIEGAAPVRKFFLLIFLLLISPPALAWVIEGNSVVEQDSQFSLTVTPHTAFHDSPVARFEQEFKLCNKTGADATVFLGYVFSYPLRSGKVLYWKNGEWIDVTSYFTQYATVYKGKHIYPYIDGKIVKAGSCEYWRVYYTPANEDNTRKWDLWAWTGSAWNCVLNDTCVKVVRLDPWWDAGWFNRAPILLQGNIRKYGTVQVPVDFSIKIVRSDLADVRVVDSNTGIELDRVCEGKSSAVDGNCFFRAPNPNYESQSAADRNTTYYMYWNNPSASAPPDINANETDAVGFEANESYTLDSDTGDENCAYAKAGGCSYSLLASKEIRKDFSLGAHSADLNYCIWASTATPSAWFVANRLRQAPNDICSIKVNPTTQTFWVYADNDGVSADTSVSVSQNTWYRACIFYPDTTTTCYFSIFDSSNAALYANSLTASSSTTASFYIETGAGAIANIDNMPYGLPWIAAGLGSTETTQAVGIDLNILAIDGYPQNALKAFTYSTDGNLTIDFNVFNADNNAMNVDINYSTSALKGTGTPIVVDLNLSAGVCPKAQQWDGNAVLCHWDWNIMFIPDNNYYILMDLNGGGSQTFFKAMDKSFRILAPSFDIQVWDENKGYPLVSPTVALAGNSYSLDSQGKASINIVGLNGRYTLTIREDGNYSTRYFDFDLNSASKIDLNLFLLRDTNGQSVSFKFYDTDQTTILASKLIRVIQKDNNICSMRYTNSNGETSFFLDPDANYVFEIVKSESQVLQYYPVQLTINIPKDEATLADIAPFDVVGSRLAEMSWLNVSDAVTYLIHSNTKDYYDFDFNASEYKPRNYLVAVKGNPATHALQAYLVSATTGIESLFQVRNHVSSAGLAGILIEAKKTIPGVGTVTIESTITDSAGEATLSFIEGDTYSLYFYQNNILRYSVELKPTSTLYQVYLETQTYTVPIPLETAFTIAFQPSRGIAWIFADGTIDMNQSISVTDGEIQSATVEITNAGTTIYSVTLDGNTQSAHSMFFWQDFNAWLLNRMAAIKVKVTVSASNGLTHTETTQYYIQSTTSTAQSQLLPALLGFGSQQFGGNQAATSIIALFATIVLVGIAASKASIDLGGLSFLATAILGLFTWIGWIPFGAFILAAIIAFSLFIITRRFD